MKYFFRFWKNDDDRLIATCLNLHACNATGDSLIDLKLDALRALNEYLTVPPANYLYPSTYRGDISRTCERLGISVDSTFAVALPAKVAFAIELRRERTNAQLYQHQMAQLLGLRTISAYQRFEDPRRANPTLKSIEKIKSILPGFDIANVFETDG